MVVCRRVARPGIVVTPRVLACHQASDATTEAGDVIARMACEFSYEDASPDTGVLLVVWAVVGMHGVMSTGVGAGTPDFYGDNDFNYIVRTYQVRPVSHDWWNASVYPA